MTERTMTISHDETPGTFFAGSRWPVLAVLMIWFLTILVLAWAGAFVEPAGQPPVAVLAAVLLPPVLFWTAYSLLVPVRAWVASLDLAMITAMQAWRVVGAAFVLLWGLGELPAVFAVPAGFGDIVVGVFAAAVAVQVARGTGRGGEIPGS